MYRFTVTIIIFVYGFLFCILCFRHKNTLTCCILANPRADRRIICYVLGNDVQCALQRLVCALYSLFHINIFRCFSLRVPLSLLLQDPVSQRLKSFFLRNTSPRLTLLLEGTIQVLYFLKLDRIDNLLMKLLGQLALLFNIAYNVFFTFA
ncbi:hypothetical protein D3C75_609360 [compost metagenome]